MIDREGIAKQNGFNSYTELLGASEPLPMLPGDVMQSYIARHPRGFWFVWDDVPEKSAGREDESD